MSKGKNKKINIKKLLSPQRTLPEHLNYQIFKSNTPIIGLQYRRFEKGVEVVSGYLILKKERYTPAVYSGVRDFKYEPNSDVNMGVDFGSNNTAISYAIKGQNNPKPLEFKNRRVFLVGKDKDDNIADRNEILFWSNQEINNGQLKSWVQFHDSGLINTQLSGDFEFKNGNMVLKTDVSVKNVDKDFITHSSGVIRHNLKWDSKPEAWSYKKAFLITNFVASCAELFINNLKPQSLRWAHPGSLSIVDIADYRNTYNYVLRNNPIKNSPLKLDEPLTESIAVSNYAITSGGVGVGQTNLLVGIDVGGSTSDILILKAGNLIIRQNSLRLSAKWLTKAFESSTDLRKCLSYFSKLDKKYFVSGIENVIKDSNSTSYYFNNLVDKLKTLDDCKFIYETLHNPNDHTISNRENCKKIFIVPAYICGFLAYYSGLLTACSIKNEDTSRLKQIYFYVFGKGGRIFDWIEHLAVGKSESEKYLKNCFIAGMGEKYNHLDFIRMDNDSPQLLKNKKMEVSYGLALDNEVKYDEKKGMIDTGVWGENNFESDGTTMELMSEDFSEFYSKLNDWKIPDTYSSFVKFLNQFGGICVRSGLLDVNQFKSTYSTFLRKKESDLINYIKNDEEFMKFFNLYKSNAKNHSPLGSNEPPKLDFGLDLNLTGDVPSNNPILDGIDDVKFTTPVVVMIAMVFLEKYLLPENFNSYNK